MRCRDCPGSDEEAKVIAEAFGLPNAITLSEVVHPTPLHMLVAVDTGTVSRRVPDRDHIAMWHALVRSYRTLVRYYPAEYGNPNLPEPKD